jgi:hypothetical protein
MRKFFLLTVLIFLFAKSFAQTAFDSIPINIDSIERELDLFLSQYGSVFNKSSLQFTTGFHNSSLSINNKALNAQQTNNPLVFSSGLNYRHKTGITIGVEPRFITQGKQTGFLQSAFSAGYWYNKNTLLQAGVTYTRYLKNPGFSSFATPYSGEWYGFAQTDKWKINPLLTIGYSSGNYFETLITDSSFLLNRPFPRPDTFINFKIYDTLRVGLRDFSLTTGLTRRFIFNQSNPKHLITFTPSLLFFFAQNNYDVEYTSASAFSPRLQLFLQQRPLLREQLLGQLRQQFPGLNETRSFLNTTRFTLQSIGFNLDAVFYHKKFFLNPQLYLDYYILDNRNQLNAFYSLEAGILF